MNGAQGLLFPPFLDGLGMGFCFSLFLLGAFSDQNGEEHISMFQTRAFFPSLI